MDDGAAGIVSTAEGGDAPHVAVWRQPEPLGAVTGGTTFGTVAAPLLAGFSLSAVIALADREHGGVRGDLGVLAFAAAAALLVFAIQMQIVASRLQASPADRLAWTPETRVDDDWLLSLREWQWRDEGLAAGFRVRAKHTYNLGVVAFLGGLVCVLVPDPGEWRAARVVALAAAATALLLELLLMAGRPRVLRARLAPTLEDHDRRAGRPTDEGEVTHEMPELTADELRWVLGLPRPDVPEQASIWTGRMPTT